MTGNSDQPQATLPSLGRYWWTPLGFLTAALLLLLGTPMVVGYRVRHLRRELTDGTDRALVVVNDFEAALATELLARDERRFASSRSADSTIAASLQSERRDALELETLARALDSGTVTRFAKLRAVERARHMDRTGTGISGVFRTDAASPSLALQALSAARQLQAWLQSRSTAARASIRSLEQIDMFSALSLVPIALVSVAVVVWIGRRVLGFAEALEIQHTALVRATEARSALLRGVTHDVKNPLGAALGYTDLITQTSEPLSAAQSRMLGRIRHLLSVSLGTISDLLDLARSDASELHVVLDSTDLVKVIREVAEDYRGAAQEKGQTLEVETARLCSLRTDSARVRQILANLVSNAIKYTPPNGRVLVRLRTPAANADSEPSKAIAIEVHDSGPGVPVEFRARIFDEFFRLTSAERAAAGTGVGLTISRRLAELLGGELVIGDSPLGGASFTLRLPAAPEPHEDTAASAGTARPSRYGILHCAAR